MNEATSPIPQDTTPARGCDCIDETNGLLSQHNTELGLSFLFRDGRTITLVALQTDLIEKKRGAKPMRILPSFCPFCGTRYPIDAETGGSL